MEPSQPSRVAAGIAAALPVVSVVLGLAVLLIATRGPARVFEMLELGGGAAWLTLAPTTPGHPERPLPPPDDLGLGGIGGLGLGGSGIGDAFGSGSGIGLGTLGTIGHGSGGGVEHGRATVMGSLSSEVIRRVVRRHSNEVRFCYEQALARSPDPQGRLSVRFVVSATGSVDSATVQGSTLRQPSVEECVVRAARRWTFPAPEGGGIVVVTYPFVFTTSR